MARYYIVDIKYIKNNSALCTAANVIRWEFGLNILQSLGDKWCILHSYNFIYK